jgi:hypothetical protein
MIFCYDESEKNDTKAFMSRLKTLTTSETLRVEPKYMNAFSVQNYCRLFFPTNAREPFQITKGARRWVYLKGSDKYIKNGIDYVYFVSVNVKKDDTAECIIYLIERPEKIKEWPEKPNLYGDLCLTYSPPVRT